jgi:rSAM/selenodomain-associated transferase 2
MRVSVIVPVLDEAVSILRTLASVRTGRGQDKADVDAEIILVDGGSRDGTAELAAPHCDQLIRAVRGRANQMNAGASAASGEWLLFLHADTLLPHGAIARLAALPDDTAPVWGRFDVHIDGAHPMLRVVAALMNLRSRMTGIATGDQAIFVRRAAFLAIGGFPQQPLMEDIEISRRLKRIAPPLCLREQVRTSGRRWETRGLWRTIALMWTLRLRYWLGTPAEKLARIYR